MKNILLIFILVLLFSCKKENQKEDVNSKLNKDTISKIENKSDDSVDESNLYKEYCNDRYQFCIDYPSTFISQGESCNNDGQKFISKDKKTEITAFGGLCIDDVNSTINELLEIATKDEKIIYKLVKEDFFIISYFDKKGNIVYNKTVLKKLDNYFDSGPADVHQTILITYPKNQSDLYSDYCKVIANSIK